jgi:hypothetical protein
MTRHRPRLKQAWFVTCLSQGDSMTRHRPRLKQAWFVTGLSQGDSMTRHRPRLKQGDSMSWPHVVTSGSTSIVEPIQRLS